MLISGPSGSGKSTLLLIMAGIIPDLIPGALDGRIDRNSGRLGIVLQNPEAQMVAPTVEEELAFGLENLGIPPEEMKKRIDTVLQQMDIVHLKHRLTGQLSGGERQKVSLASALTLEPTLLLLDEPTSYLDPQATRSFFAILKKMKSNLTVIIVEHKLEYVENLCDRFFELDEQGSLNNDYSLKYLFASCIKPAVDLNIPAAALEEKEVLKTEKLSHSYRDEACALKENTFALKQGETLAVMGPNGSGKTTLLEKLSKILPVEQSTLWLNGRDLSSLNAEQIYSQLMLLPQNPEHMFLTESVKEELNLSSSSIEAAAGQFRLENLLSQNPYSLSEGEKRRLTLACAFLDDRKIILLDEPTYSLDCSAFEALIQALKLLKENGASILMATHSPELAFLTADRFIILNEGKIAFIGTKEEMLAQEDEFIKYFIPYWERGKCRGLMNMYYPE